MTAENSEPVNRSERILASMMLGMVALGVLSFFAVIIGTMLGMSQADYSSGLWPVVTVLPFIVFPLAAVLMLTLTIKVAIRRKRENTLGGDA